MWWSAKFRILAGCAALIAATTPSWPQSNDEAGAEPAAQAEPGKDEYLRHCAVCHGLDGRGNGPLANAMKIVPADLTRLSTRNQGTYPAAKIGDVIRNGGGVLGHGSTAMLPWGIYFSERGNPAVAKARIKALVEYIETIQEK
jgi:mono/diheme cytochrome c family protein